MAGFTAQLIDKREYYVNTEIKPFVPMESQQLTLFDMPAFDQPEDTPVAPLSSHPKLPQQIMDEALCVGANDEHSRLIICAYFMKDKPDNAAFLQNTTERMVRASILAERKFRFGMTPRGCVLPAAARRSGAVPH